MQTPLVVRSLTAGERHALEAGLRASDAFVLRRCQILLANARGEHAPQIAANLGCSSQTVRNAIHAFNQTGLDALARGSSRPHTSHPAFDADALDQLRALLHQSPRAFGHPTSLWTLERLATVCAEQGLTSTRVTGETVRATLARAGLRWQRAKGWITSPDPAYAHKNSSVTG